MSVPVSTERIDWVDYAKGIGIILVVYGHVAIGVNNSGLKIPLDFYDYSQKFIYSFHMPLFFFLSVLSAVSMRLTL